MAIEARFEEKEHAERRDSARLTLRLGVAARFGHDRRGAATVHNLSATGLLVETATALSEDETFAVELPEVGEREARVVWADAPHYGCRFAEPIGTAALAAAQLRAATPETSSRGAAGAFPERLRALRKDRALSLGELANRLGVSKPTVWAWEHGKSRPVDRRLAGLAEVLGVTPGILEGSRSDNPEVVDRSRRLIAETYGVEPARVRIMIEL